MPNPETKDFQSCDKGRRPKTPRATCCGVVHQTGKALPGWLWPSGEGGIPARRAAAGSVLCPARHRLAAGTGASRCSDAPRRHCVIQRMISGRTTNLGSRTPAGLLKALGEGSDESSPREAGLAGLSRGNGQAAVQSRMISSARQGQGLRSVVKRCTLAFLALNPGAVCVGGNGAKGWGKKEVITLCTVRASRNPAAHHARRG